MSTVRPLYGTTTAVTITLDALATDSGLLIGRQSTMVDNTSDLAMDVLIQGKIKAGASTPTNLKQIEIWAIGGDGSNRSAGAGASDAGFTPTGEKTLMRLLTIIPTDATADHVYEFGPLSLAQAFGGVVPKSWGIYVVHNMGVSLAATGHEIKYTPVQWDITA